MSKAFAYERSDQKDEWLTPPWIIEQLGPFDLDPCAPINRPWDMAKHHFTEQDNGLAQEWFGRVWMNPPYGRETHKWLDKLSRHGNGIALILARTETKMFFKYIWDMATAILFIKRRINFHNVDGSAGSKGGVAPSCLVAYGKENAEKLKNSKIEGRYIDLV